MLLAIKKDHDMQLFLNSVNEYVSIDIFVEAEKVLQNVVPDDSAVGDWGTYMSMIT